MRKIWATVLNESAGVSCCPMMDIQDYMLRKTHVALLWKWEVDSMSTSYFSLLWGFQVHNTDNLFLG